MSLRTMSLRTLVGAQDSPLFDVHCHACSLGPMATRLAVTIRRFRPQARLEKYLVEQ